jgi:lipoate synthase
VVITSVDRDDLRGGGSGRVRCIQHRALSPATAIEITWLPTSVYATTVRLEILKPPTDVEPQPGTAPRLAWKPVPATTSSP